MAKLDGSFAVALTVPNQYLADVLEGAGSRYWCERLRFNEAACSGGDAGPSADLTCWEALLLGKLDRVRVIVQAELEPDRNVRHYVTRESLAAAVQIIRDKFPHHLGAVLGHDTRLDAETGDVLLQCAALGDIVYG